jgi:hypothetical protein
MRTQVWLGLVIIAGAPVLTISYAIGVIANLTSAVETIIVTTVGIMLVSGLSLLWNARKPDEQANQRKRTSGKQSKSGLNHLLTYSKYEVQKNCIFLARKSRDWPKR